MNNYNLSGYNLQGTGLRDNFVLPLGILKIILGEYHPFVQMKKQIQ